ncbi:hypothetical protein M427DRAFT_105180 [Gonapodya prolifera JEL478]|uniref:Transcription factor CBF/NF-Y/archaeal histone domain-containing protein n=1 Tax=Gonapodya prolifera (strain JEL478) TaxID=1344416 RepID=A0A138ZYL1_GONPJ|nr:hypothetical protein M427DRAFT_105180 [Gonapodya prolifera JEL478]|eukprot:KXS09592.1 hypothetical protein M427DRAFT_105180 [Gonapodya prolifera JEL478]
MDDRAEPDPAHSNDDSGVRNSDDGGGADLTRSRVSDKAPVQDHDRLLPVANVARIMKNALPENAKISKEAKECVQECVSEFVAFLTSEAADKCSTDRRKTVSGEDIIWAMDSLGFDMYAATMRTFLQRYKDVSFIFHRARSSSRLLMVSYALAARRTIGVASARSSTHHSGPTDGYRCHSAAARGVDVVNSWCYYIVNQCIYHVNVRDLHMIQC